MARGHELAHARRHQADAVLMNLDFLRTTDLHLSPLSHPRGRHPAAADGGGTVHDYPLRIPCMATAHDPTRLAAHPAQLTQAFELQRRAFDADPYPAIATRRDRLDRLRRMLREQRLGAIRDAISADFGMRAAAGNVAARAVHEPRGHRPCAATPATLDADRAAERRLVEPAGQRAPAAPAAGRGRHHRAVELPAVPRGVAADGRTRRRQSRHAQDVGVHAALRRAVRVPDRAQLSRPTRSWPSMAMRASHAHSPPCHSITCCSPAPPRSGARS